MGFDGNNEGKQMAYARHYCEQDGGRFEDLKINGFNSHLPMLCVYRSMLVARKSSANQHSLTGNDICRVLASSD
jgi:uncharacterized protein YfbU (UPF0304 family)